MVKIVVQAHVLRVAAGGRGKIGIVAQRTKSLSRSFNIYQDRDLTFEIGMNNYGRQKKTNSKQTQGAFHQFYFSPRQVIGYAIIR
jgi:hypothetical protein